MISLFCDALQSDANSRVQINATDNLILYLQKIITTSEDDLERFYPIVSDTFKFIHRLPDEAFNRFVRSFYGIKRLAQNLLEVPAQNQLDHQSINHLLARYLDVTYTYWLGEADPLERFRVKAEIAAPSSELETIFNPIAHRTIESQRSLLQKRSANGHWHSLELLKSLVSLNDHRSFAKAYRRIPDQLLELAGRRDTGNQWKVIFLFQAMNTPGLANDHEDILRDINRTINWLIGNQKPRHVHKLIQKTFSILKAHAARFPSTSSAGWLG